VSPSQESQHAVATFGVLVVSGGGFQGLALIRSLRASGRIRIVMADCHADNVGRYFVDQFHRVPPVAERDAFLHALLAICRLDAIRVVLPCTDWELQPLAEARDAFGERGVLVGVPDAGLLALLRHKHDLHEALVGDGLPVLPRLSPRVADSFPLLGKPASGWGGRGHIVVRSAAELAAVPAEALDATHLWQPLLEDFEELSADFSIDFRGRASGVGLRRRVRTSGGFAVVSECSSDAESEKVVSGVVSWLAARGGRGLFNVQVLESGGRRFVSDVNPRIGTSAVHWCGTGVNPALHLCADAGLRLEDPPDAGDAGPPARVVRYLAELASGAEAPASADQEVEGVVFDLDDTLIPHKRWILAKLEILHAAAAALLPARSDFLREALALVEEGHAEALFDRLAQRFGWPEDLKGRLIETYRGAAPSRCPVFGDVWPTLDTLRRRGLKLALLTDNPPASQQQKVEAAGLAGAFDAIVYAQELGAEKPDPRGFEAAASRLGVEPALLAMVGDNPYRDVRGALAAGYARAFLVRRPGTLFNFDPALSAALAATPVRPQAIDGLQPLLSYLLGAARALEDPARL
jgi:HAD superfamily hydrolase (TIGR01509 family)